MSETEKADIVERLRGAIDEHGISTPVWRLMQEAAAEIERLRSVEEDNKQAGEIIIELKREVERLRALTSRDDVLEEAARVADKYNDSANRLLTGDARYGANTATQGVAAAIRALKDTDNG